MINKYLNYLNILCVDPCTRLSTVLRGAGRRIHQGGRGSVVPQNWKNKYGERGKRGTWEKERIAN